MNVIPQPKSFSKSSPKASPSSSIKANNKDLINQISSLISIELSRIDTEDIHNEFNSLFPYQTTTQSSYISSLTSTISNLKRSTISSVSNFLSCYTFPNSSNYFAKEEEYITMIFSINTEIKNLIKQSKIKFKQNKDYSNALGFSINVIGENIQNGKIDLAMERIAKIDEIKNEIEKNLIYIEEYQTKFYDNVKNIIKNTTNEIPKNNKEQSPNPIQSNVSTIKKTSYMTYSSNGKKLNKSVNHYKSKSKEPNPSSEEIINALRNKTKELSKEISLLKKRIKTEQDSKAQIQNELIILKQKNFSASKSNGYSGEKSMSNITTDLKLDNLNKRIKSLSDMILTFSLSMNNLRDSLIRKNISVIDIQSDYKNLKKQLYYLSSTAVSLKSKIEKKNEDYNTMKTYDSSSNIKKCSEFNNISSIMDASGEFSTSYNNGNTNNDTLSKVIENAKQKEIDSDEDDNSSNNNNDINLKHLSNIVITFRNDETNIQKEPQTPFINIKENNNNNDSPIREESNINIEELINENKNLKSQLASQLLLNSSQTEIEQLKSELSMAEAKIKELNMSNSMIGNQNKEKILDGVLKRELIELKAKNEKCVKESNEIIEKKNKEIEELKIKIKNSNENVFKNLIENYNNNLVNIKQSYEDVISEKNKKIDELNLEIIALNEKINEINAKLYNSQNEKRTQNIIKEASMSNLENEKISLQITIEQLQKEIEKYKKQEVLNNSSNEKTMILSSQIENLNFKIKTLTSQIDSKDKIIQSLQSKKEENNKSNSSLISQMDTKIKSLQSEILSKVNIINELKKESNDKTKQIDILTQNYQNDLNELNTSVILLKSKISKLQEENISMSYRQRNTMTLCSIHHIIDITYINDETKQKEIDKLKKEISTLKSQPNDDSSSTRTDHQNLSMRNANDNSVTRTSTDKDVSSNRQISKQKEELTVLKAKLRSTLEENKTLSTKVNELEFAARKEKDEYMTVLRSAFDKFLNETQITQKNKEFNTILLKMMNYTDDDINDIYSNLAKKKEKVSTGVFSFLRK